MRFVFWKRGEKDVKPVVDIVFDGRDTYFNNWFTKVKVLDVKKGPHIQADFTSNYWSSDGDKRERVQRHFFVSKKYAGCQNDVGFIAVTDK